MRALVLPLAFASAFTFAADNAASAPRSAAGQQFTIAGRQSPVAYRPDAVTIPQILSYQCRLTDTLGQQVRDTTYSVAFRLYTVLSGGSPFWNETQNVTTKDGLFSVLLGSVTPIDSVPSAGAAYLGMAVAGGPELVPRLRIASAAYAHLSARAAIADLLQGKDTTGFVRTGQPGSVTSAMIADATIAPDDLGEMGASTGQVMKWNGSTWEPRDDSLAGSSDSAWVRVGSDSVLYTIRRLGIAKGGAGNALYGESTHTHVNLGMACTTGTSGQSRYYCTVGGGYDNRATCTFATISGGYNNSAAGFYSVVGGGFGNGASDYSTVGGGVGNNVAGEAHTVSGGYSNTATGEYATISGGLWNSVGGSFTAVGGGCGNAASGDHAVVPGGRYCAASGNQCFAAGSYAKARGAGSFAWSDSCSEGDSVRNATANRWTARARGGVYFYTNLGMTTGAYLSAGGSSWNSVSDSMTKENFRPVDKRALLETLARMRVRDYNLKSQDPSIRHIGPVAQDFHNAFGFGESNTAINMEDADGVLLAAVQALYDQNQVQQAEIEALKAELKRS